MENVKQAQIIYDAFGDIMKAVASTVLPHDQKYDAQDKVCIAYRDIMNAIGFDAFLAHRLFSRR